jgi:hypothetical protein
MDRKEFLRNSLLATGAILLPNAIWAFDKNFNAENRSLNKFVSKPNLKRFKVSELGTKFFETELSIIKSKTDFKLHRKFFISENTNGICTPTLLETERKKSLVFIPELYKDEKHNGFIVKICENGICEETKIFTHENQGYYAFWGKEYLGNPTLYHYNAETFHLMRMHQENGQWINRRVMQIYPNEMTALYKQQLQQVEQGQLTQQFGYDFEIHKDGFYQFLSLKNEWEKSIITKEKEAYENSNPAKILTTVNDQKLSPEKTPSFDYTNPFVPIYCKGDDLSHATIKPTIIYEEVAGTKIEIPNMPAYRTQNGLGECRAFSLAVLLQYYTCQKWKSDIPDCKNPPADSAISYFGLLAYTNQIVDQPNTFQPNQEKTRSMYNIIEGISKSGNRLILESCKPFDNLTKNFSASVYKGEEKRDDFFNYLKQLFLTPKNKNNIVEYTAEVNKLNDYVDLKFNQPAFIKAIRKENFDEFLYTLFFDDCKRENFPSGFSAMAFPLDQEVTTNDLKLQVIEGLKYGKPVNLPYICISANIGNKCEEGHSIVIAGFKNVVNKNDRKDLFKVHNSWGVEWQKGNNDGWVDADIICQNIMKVKSEDGSYKITPGSVIWLTP